MMMIQGENGLIVKSEHGLEIERRMNERQEPLKNISAYYDEAKKVEEDARTNAEAYIQSLQPAQAMSTDEQIQALTKTVAELTVKLGAK